MNWHYVVLWSSLCVLFALCALWCAYKNRQLKRRLQAEGNTALTLEISAFFKLLVIPLLSLLAVSLLALGAYDYKLQFSSTALASLDAIAADQNGTIEALKQAQVEASQREAQMRATLSQAQQVAAKQTTYYPPAGAAATQPVGAGSPIDDLYNPEDTITGKQADLDRIKKRYEEILVNNMFMKKCGKAKPADIHIIISALSQEMASVNAPGRLQYDILTSARGSYKEMYADSPCDTPGSAALEAQYAKYIDSISSRLNEP